MRTTTNKQVDTLHMQACEKTNNNVMHECYLEVFWILCVHNVSTPGCISHGVSYSNVDKLGTTSRKVVQALVGYHCCIILCL